ncbi:NAD(P)-dependent oxidoreductase [Mucilaginibacter sp. MD40]|uniref:SDR family oxidoreductase n=1 Tax=Mucilaginibacter sp. MD40 TaxID=2029590 RepID=UPI000BAC7336|nr:SDR family oxidoreductase [Mucilaginibacter sp. MD40]PAW92311.1 NAD(P)-dependent oxidoreductase [Mucilaginibacter sp. MD40]
MNNILVTGATGQLGQLVVNELLSEVSPEQISVMVRDPGKAIAWQKLGIKVITGDYSEYNSLLEAFNRTEKLYFISSSDKADRFGQHINVVRAAAAAKVGHLIYTSAHRRSEDASSLLTADAHWQTDALIKQSDLKFTILKHGLYAELLPFFIGTDFLESGLIELPAGNGKSSYATRQDLAAAAVKVLITEGHEFKTYDLGSAQSYSFQDVAALMTELTGERVVYSEISIEAYETKMQALKVPEHFIKGVLHFCNALKVGEFDFPSTDLKMLLGREPKTIKEFLKDAYGLSHVFSTGKNTWG